jgi:hypothetical protein
MAFLLGDHSYTGWHCNLRLNTEGNRPADMVAAIAVIPPIGPVLTSMLADAPDDRPTASKVVAMLKDALKRL